MTRAYRVPVADGGVGTTEGGRARVLRGRPNWWVILAVSLALMALLVATADNAPRTGKHKHGVADAPSDAQHPSLAPAPASTGPAGGARPSPATTTTTAVRATSDTTRPTTSLLSTPPAPRVVTPTTAPPSVTTSTVAPTTTTTTTVAASSPNDRTQTQGILNPPQQRSNSFAFTGNGPTTISVIWSGSTYLTLDVSCPNGSQNAGGTAAMAVTLPNASGSCLATVSEPASESTALTYTITIGPAGG